jgi:hypothetical protein
MSERRRHRGILRTDEQILAHPADMHLLEMIARGQLTAAIPELRMDLARLAREDLVLAGFGSGSPVTLLPRGQRVVAVARGGGRQPRNCGGWRSHGARRSIESYARATNCSTITGLRRCRHLDTLSASDDTMPP